MINRYELIYMVPDVEVIVSSADHNRMLGTGCYTTPHEYVLPG
jgi:hypothetical protein